ncbi:MAG: hypothetical protein CVV41_19030 [Candidatus Riflebacteria bacterium HGW-Riflebacteria-1]|jgi:hypothetical protein|nr:MAG: hypothetical protein CVV41_19030 [Candidatus Riflebacteria bacterium HGW-Riflebacteria-1]
MPGLNSQQKCLSAIDSAGEIHSDTSNVWSKKQLTLLLILLLVMLPSLPAFALNQIVNGSFTADLTGWFQSAAVVTDGTFTFTADTTGFQTQRSLRAQYVKNNSGSNNFYYPAQRYIQQAFLTAPRSTNVRAKFTSAHREDAPNNTEWKINHNGTIRKSSDQEAVVGTFYNESHQVYPGLHLTWPAAATVWETELEANTSYVARILFDFESWKGNTTTAWVDYITCNVSPAGLIASETTSGQCQLNWDASTGPATGTPKLHLTNPYRVYRSYTSDTGPWTQIATRSVTNYLDTPTQNVAWYTVTDVDTSNEESPSSLVATYRTARLEITKVETTTTNVTKGQNGLPVRVYVTNTGLTTATVNTIELLFDSPQYGLYSIGGPSLSLPFTLTSGQSEVITFLIAVATGSNSGIDFIDARVTGTNTQTLAGISDNGSDVKASWLIQEPPNLVLIDIQASPTVYLDQIGVGVYLTVRNDGEAAAVWDLWNNTELFFTLGDYLNPRPYGVASPYSEVIYTGQTKTIRYDVDISPFSATGTSSINASMSYVDGNTYNAFNYNIGDPTPPSWTIRSGILKTYRGPAQFPAYVIESSSFNLGNFTVYTKGTNLQPDRDFRLRWYPPVGAQIAEVSATNLSGELFGSYTLSGDPTLLGRWRVIVSRVTNEIPLCETYFDVVDAASLSVDLYLPDFVTVNQPFDVKMSLVNSGGSRIDTAYASPLTLAGGNTGSANFISGPSQALVTVDPHSFTDITWSYTAGTIGSFTVLGNAYGVDSNDLRNLVAATETSNMCIIQSPAVLSITSVNTTETQVYRNQQNLIVDVGVANNGSASAWITETQLSFSNGNHLQTLVSPELPCLLANGAPTTLQFVVAVASNSPTGAVTITASYTAIDANWPASTPVTVHSTPLSDAWTIVGITAFCSGNNSFSPEQYKFNAEQTVYAKFTGLPLNTTYRIVYLPAADTAVNATPNAGTMNSGTTAPGFVSSNYTLPTAALGKWKTELWTITGGSGNLNALQARQFFDVQSPGSITASLNFVPDDIELNGEVTLEMSLANNVVSGSTIENIVPSLPLEYGGSTGELLLLTGPQPATAILPAGSAATFTWTYRATEHSGLSGTYQMIATATGNDANLPTLDAGYVGSIARLSNPLTIRYRELSYASATLAFGTMVCGESKTVGTSRVNNLGSTDLTRARWNKGFYISELFDEIHPNNLTIYPLSGFTVPAAAPSYTDSYAVMTIPYNQPAGSYVATMTVFEDMSPYNGVLDAGEPAYQFSSTVIASACRVLYTNPDVVDLGDWKIGNLVATRSITILNGGNLPLGNIKIASLTPLTFTMYITTDGTTSLATDETMNASISAHINAGAIDGDYTVNVTIWDDMNDNGTIDSGEASDTFQVEIGVGTQLMHFTPAMLDFGYGTPTFALPELSFQITNIGDRTLDRLKYSISNLYHVDLPAYYIPGDEVEMILPAAISVSATQTAYVNMFIPAGSAIGTYTGSAVVFEDEDGDGTYIGDDNEAPATLTLQVYVNPYRGLRVLTPVVDAGPLSPTESGIAVFSAKNTGNVVLDKLTWQKIPLSAGANTLNEINYDFEPVPFFVKPFNTIFLATMTLGVPLGQPDGDYSGQFARLLDFMGVASDPQSPFTVSCQVGTKFVDITEPALLIEDAMPSFLSTTASFEIRNSGTLMLIRPMATATAFVGPSAITATASIFTPPVFDYMIANKTFNGTWKVQVPPGAEVGTYFSTMTVWNDTNNNSKIDPGEASDTAILELRVIAKTVIGISPASLEFGYVAPDRSSSVNFDIVNLGNQDISGLGLLSVASQLQPFAPGPIPIPAAKLVFSPVPFAVNLPKGGSIPAVATITIPIGQSTVNYQGLQMIYVDENANGSYTDGEINTTFYARVSVGEKQFSVSDVNMGIRAHATTANTNFQLVNNGNISLSRIRWQPQNISNGSHVLTPTFSSAGASVNAGGTLNCTVSVVIPPYTPAGIYTATQVVFDDDYVLNGTLNNPNEASASFLLTLEVLESPQLTIISINPVFPLSLSLGLSTHVDVTYQNTGNATFTDLTWGSPMATMNGSEGDSMIPTFSPAPLAVLTPGASHIASITFAARVDQATGTYTGVQTLSSTAYPAANTNVAPSVLVISQTGPKDLEKGTVFQNIATETFAAGGDFIFSVYVGFEDGLPASGTIGFRQDKTDDTPAVLPISYVTIDQSGNIVAANPAGAGGVASSIKSGNKTWYRLYLKFPGALNPLTESTYLILSNSSTSTIPKVWFDGVQLERANGRDRPTSFGEGSKIISPSNRIDLEGKSRYSDW